MRSKLVNGAGLELAWSRRVYGVSLRRNLLPQDPYLFFILFSVATGWLDAASDHCDATLD
jgi:hypothetical protein